MASWGSTTLNIKAGTYVPIHSYKRYNLTPLIPSPIDPDENVNILQDGGRDPEDVSFTCYVTTLAEYNNYRTDYINGTERTFTGPNSETLLGIIFELGKAMQINDDYFEFNMTIMEV